MKMEPFSVSQSALPQLHVRLTRSQRTLIAEAQRIVLHYSKDIIAHCAAVAGTEGAKVADEVCNMLLRRRMPPETWPLPRLLHLLSQTSPAPGTAEKAALPREAFHNIVRDIEQLKALQVLYETVAVYEFDHLIDARGQAALSLANLSFPSLSQGGIFDPESLRVTYDCCSESKITCAAIPVLLKHNPFVQGLENVEALGRRAADTTLTAIAAPKSAQTKPGDKR